MTHDGVVAELSRHGAQKILGAYYACGRIPTHCVSTIDASDADGRISVHLDLTLDRPRIELRLESPQSVVMHVLLMGTAEPRNGPLAGRRHRVHLKGRAVMPLRPLVLAGRTVQVVADHTVVRLYVDRVRSPDGPLPSDLGRALSGESVTAALQAWLRRPQVEGTESTMPWRLSAELFDEIAPKGGDLAAAVGISVGFNSIRVGLQTEHADPQDPLMELSTLWPQLAGHRDDVLVRMSGDLVYRQFLDNRQQIIDSARSRHGMRILELDLQMMPIGYRYFGRVSAAGGSALEVVALPILARDGALVRYAIDAHIDMPWWVDLVRYLGKALGFVVGPVGMMIGKSIDLVLDSIRAQAEGDLEQVLRRTSQRFTLRQLPEIPARAGLRIDQLHNGLVAINGQRTAAARSTLSIGGLEIVGPTHTSPDALPSARRRFYAKLSHGVVLRGESRVRVRWDWIRSGKPRHRSEQALQPGNGNEWTWPEGEDHHGTSTLEVSVFREETDGSRQELARAKKRIHYGKRLATDKPFVRWRHAGLRPREPARVRAGAQRDLEPVWLGDESYGRTSKVHKTNPASRCPDADQFGGDIHPNELEYLDTLPHDPSTLCHACFAERFSGPGRP